MIVNLLWWMAIAFALAMTAIVVIERAAFGLGELRRLSIERRYTPLLWRALAGDDAARAALAASPRRHRPVVASLLILPLIDDRDPDRIAAARTIAQAMSILQIADRYLRSRRWWRRALAARAIGLVQARDRTAAIVAALDDRHPDVRAAALDALADLCDPASLHAIVVRLHDPSLQLGRRAAALAAFGPAAETFLLALADVDRANRVTYARALGICGTSRARPMLCVWTSDEGVAVRAAAFEALGRIGLDDESARLAVEALESNDEAVRAMAARALTGWTGGDGAAAHLARHLDDTWTVAVHAARSLQSMGSSGRAQLSARAAGPGLAGLLARQMLWQPGAGMAS